MPDRKPPVGTIRLKRIENDALRAIQSLTTARSTRPVTSQSIREVATQMDAVTAHLWQVANDMDSDDK